MENNELFLTLFKDLEQILNRNYKIKDGESALRYFESESKYPRSNYIKVIRDTRNLMQHNTTKIDGKEVFLVSDTTIELLTRLIFEQEHPKRATDVCTKVMNLYTAELNSSLKEVVEKMALNNYSHVPVLDKDGRLFGVFSENTLFSGIAKDKIILIEEHNLIRDFADVLPIDNHNSEVFTFVAKMTKVDEMKQLFSSNYPNDKKLALMFVTEHGKASEKITGIITPWDLIQY